jgi:filamentous hemagglutinin family protein
MIRSPHLSTEAALLILAQSKLNPQFWLKVTDYWTSAIAPSIVLPVEPSAVVQKRQANIIRFVVAGCLGAVTPRVAPAQHITIDGRFSPAQTLGGPNYSIGANLGKQVGGNLFHSFGQFSLSNTPIPESATFTSTGSTGPISNVIGRVTGGSPSSIDGKIQSAITGANLYLINPSGIVFGPNATVNVSGSFHASTADYLKMSDGAKFQATNPDGSTLSAAPPAAFGFLNATPAKIAVNGSTLGPVPGTLGLVGGPVSVTGSALSAPAGTIHVTSVAATGEVPVDPRNKSALTVSSFGPVGITGGSRLNVSDPANLGSGGSVFIRSGALTIDTSEINADNYGSGSGGMLALRGDSQIMLTDANVHAVAVAQSGGPSPGDIVVTTAGSLALINNSTISSNTVGSGNGGKVTVNAETLTIRSGIISANTFASGAAGEVVVTAGGAIMLSGGGQITSSTAGTGNGGTVQVTAGGLLRLTDPGSGISASATSAASGNAGSVIVYAPQITVTSDGQIASSTAGLGTGGIVQVTDHGQLSLSGGGEITASTSGPGAAGSVMVDAPQITMTSGAQIASTTSGAGMGGLVAVGMTTPGVLVLDGIGTQITASTTGQGIGGNVTVSANGLTVENGAQIASSTAGPGTGGIVQVTDHGQLSLSGGGEITASSMGAGDAGSVMVDAPQITMTSGAQIASITSETGNGGRVSVMTPGALVVDGGAEIVTSATGLQSGPGGNVTVSADSLTVSGGAQIASSTAGPGEGGAVDINVANGVNLSGTGSIGITASAEPGSSGRAGEVVLTAGGAITLSGGAQVASSTAGSGNGGTIQVMAQGPLTLSGSGSGVIASAEPGSSGNAGSVTVNAPQITLTTGAEIASTTAGTGAGGSVEVGKTTPGVLMLDGMGTQITASTTGQGMGACCAGGNVTVSANGLTIEGGAQITASSMGAGDAGSVMVEAPQITMTSGAQIASTTSGTGNGGSVSVMTPGTLVLDRGAEIAASATGPQSGSGGDVTVGAASLLAEGGAQIASSTAGPGKGGDVNIAVASDITLPDPGPQITARSTGSGNAGSIDVSAARLLLSNNAAISTEAQTSTASGGNITLSIGDLLYLIGSEITTSVKGETGNGGNIKIDPQFAILDRSNIIAQAIEGHGGNIDITAATYIASADSLVSGTSQLGVSGVVTINGPLVDLNGTLVVLSSELRKAVALTREACAAEGNRPQSSLIEAGRGGVPHDTDATLPALYIAGRDLGPLPHAAARRAESEPPVPRRAALHLTMLCGEK